MSTAPLAPQAKRVCLVSLGGAIFLWTLVLAGAVWAVGALWFDFPVKALAHWVAGGYLLAVGLVCAFLRPSWRAKLVVAASVVLIIVWWFSLQPRQNRAWKTEVAELPYAEIAGDNVTIHNLRNFDYRSETDFTPRYETRRYHLANLRGADMFMNYWGSPYMAHPIVSFDFGPDGRVCFSIETRPEQGEAYSALGGLYRQFELIYVVADERDVIRLRSNYRKGENVYLYHLKAPRVREAFLKYLQSVNELKASPRWYHAITANCTTGIRNQQASFERAPWDYRMLINGLGDQLLYERKAIDTSRPFTELKQRSHINHRAMAADQNPEFSEKIREGLPGMNAGH